MLPPPWYKMLHFKNARVATPSEVLPPIILVIFWQSLLLLSHGSCAANVHPDVRLVNSLAVGVASLPSWVAGSLPAGSHYFISKILLPRCNYDNRMSLLYRLSPECVLAMFQADCGYYTTKGVRVADAQFALRLAALGPSGPESRAYSIALSWSEYPMGNGRSDTLRKSSN